MSQVLSALAGAVVAFGGAYALQRTQQRRREQVEAEERLGLIRRLRGDLEFALLLCEGALQSRHVMPGVQMPVDLWVNHGHRVVVAVHGEQEEKLIETFSRMVAINGVWAASPGGQRILDESERQKLRDEGGGGETIATDPESMELLIEAIQETLPLLDAMKISYEAWVGHLRRPLRGRVELIRTRSRRQRLGL